jgi:hypothetical protein
MRHAMPFLMLLSLFMGSRLYGSSPCPEGYVLVPGRMGVSNDGSVPSVRDFCIMKYEAKKARNSDKPVSTAEGEVWVSINRDEAARKCESVEPGGRYHLVGLPEWQTLARNIENVAENWSGRKPFVGEINQGHVNPFPDTPLPASEEPVHDPCHLTGKSCSNGVWSRFRRTHQLSNGEVIWDVSGNVWEWLRFGLEKYEDELKDLYDQNYKLIRESPLQDGFVSSAKGIVLKWFGPSHYYRYGDVPTLGSLWLSLKMGHEILLDDKGKKIENSKSGIIRGGSFGSTLDAGIVAANMIIQAKEKKLNIGFRCVYYPSPSEVMR